MNYADIKYCDVANGPGVRVSLFVSGCNHHCPGCFNQEAWDFNYGTLFTYSTMETIFGYLAPTYIRGLSLLGGEPLEHANQIALLPFLKEAKRRFPEKDIWCYTGYTLETDILGKMLPEWEETKELLSYIDILVDGRFIEKEKDITLRFRGSRNQRIIDLKETLKQNHTVLWDLSQK